MKKWTTAIVLSLALLSPSAAVAAVSSDESQRRVHPKGGPRRRFCDRHILPNSRLDWQELEPTDYRHGSGWPASSCHFPDIDGALMVLMGLGQGAYLGNKLS